MELVQVKGNTWYLAAAELIPLYRLDGTRCILLDSGLGSEREELAAALDGAGLTPVGVFGSHVHRDHSANHFWLRERYGLPVCLPASEAALCSDPLSFRATYDTFSPDMIMSLYGDCVGRTDDTVGPDDDTVVFCGVPFRAIHTPGHTPGHICTVTPDGVCYLADALMVGSAVEDARLPYHYGHAAVRASMEKLRGLSCDAFIAAHRGVISDLGPAIDANLDLLDRRGEAILRLIDQPMTLDEVYAAYVQLEKLFTSSAEKASRYIRNLRMFLDYLTDTGRLALTAQAGILRYRRAEA